ncbi:MAG: Smr/MutS family protein, partial [Chloroflexota bacterium]
ARHPLLPADEVVPVDIELDPTTYMMLITGPNTGGKTVTLKTVGLMVLMAQSGMHIPVQAGSEISLFENIYADIGDEQSIEQSLSTFSGHITNIIKILDEADSKSLVIFDELGSGTDPQEGAALAQAILDYLVKQKVPTLVATHYPELKAYANATSGIVNASMEFDIKSLRPTFRLIVGLPGRSNALSIAKRLGLQDEIVEAARGQIDPAELRAEDLLDEIHRQRDMTKQARQAAENAQQDIETLRTTLTTRLEDIEDERLGVLEATRQKSQDDTRVLRDEIAITRQELAKARKPLDMINQLADSADKITETIAEPIERERVADELPQTRSRPIRLGDRVMLNTLGKEGIVTTLGEDEGEVQIGSLRVRVDLYDLRLVSEKIQEKPKNELREMAAFEVESPGTEFSLRGKRVDEALESLELYLDKAYVANLPYVRIVHGKGTGKLREAVRSMLKGHPHIDRFIPGKPAEGGDGVTIVYMENS